MSGTVLPRATPAEKHVDPRAIAAFLDAAAANGIELHGFMLYRGGAVIAEGWWSPYRADIPHMQHSLAKSVTATAIGLAVAEGRLALDDAVVSFFPDRLPLRVGENLAAMTLRDLLTMRSGHRTGISGAAWRHLPTDWATAFLATDVSDRPGTRFVYSSASSYMLSAILQKVTGERMRDYLEPRLFAPLGISSLTWDTSPSGVNPGGNGLSFPTEASLKLGVLHLHGGMWEANRVVPQGWVRAATQPAILPAFSEDPAAARHLAEQAPDRGYGYHWWTWPDGAFLASGLFGQYAIVLPAQDAVIAVTAALPSRDDRLLDLIWRDLRPALGSFAPPAASSGTLAARLKALALDMPRPRPTPAFAAHISGRRFTIRANAYGVAAITLHLPDRNVTDRNAAAPIGRFILQDEAGTHEIALGLQAPVESMTSMPGASLHHAYQPAEMRVLATGQWVDEHVFAMQWHFIETAFRDTVLCRFTDDGVTIERSVNVNSGATSWPPLSGKADAFRVVPAEARVT